MDAILTLGFYIGFMFFSIWFYTNDIDKNDLDLWK